MTLHLAPLETIAQRLPFDQGAPHINGPSVFGVSPDKCCLFTFPVRGERPIRFHATGTLPEGITLNAETGCLSGTTQQEGDFPIQVTAINKLGKDTRNFTLKVHHNGNGLTPLLGWTSWNACCRDISQETILKNAKALVKQGLAAHGYAFINIDSGWQGSTRNAATHALEPNSAFPDMGGLVEQIHALGLKAGIYSTPMVVAWGSNEQHIYRGSTDYPVDQACWNQPVAEYQVKAIASGGFYGGYGKTSREYEDAEQWAKWKFDYLKYDWPSCDLVHAKKMKEALDNTDRDFIYSLTTYCSPEFAEDYKAIGNMFRANGDTLVQWSTIRRNIISADYWLPFTQPGSWFDLDMLALGNVHKEFVRTPFTRDECISHFSAWALLASPIQISCPLEDLDDFTLDLLSNEEVLAINQDITGKAVLVHTENNFDDAFKPTREIRIYRKPIAQGKMAYGFFNFSDSEQVVPFTLERYMAIHDPWLCSDLGVAKKLELVLPPHASRILVCTPADSGIGIIPRYIPWHL